MYLMFFIHGAVYILVVSRNVRRNQKYYTLKVITLKQNFAFRTPFAFTSAFEETRNYCMRSQLAFLVCSLWATKEIRLFKTDLSGPPSFYEHFHCS